MSKNIYTYIDLFAGAGGLSEGFICTGFEPIAHVELDEAACYTLKTRTAYHFLKSNDKIDIYNAYLRGEIDRNQLYSYIPKNLLSTVINEAISEKNNHEIFKRVDKLKGRKKIDLIIGGPPCQAYSVIGRSRSKTRMVGDHRNYLFEDYAKYLDRFTPKVFLFENVLGLKSASNGKYLAEMTDLFNSKGYDIELFTLEAVDYGILQNRKRIIILGWKKDTLEEIPDLKPENFDNKYFINDLLIDLPKLNAGEGVNKYQEYETPPTEYLLMNNIRSYSDILTQHIARPHREQDKNIYKIAVEKWNKNKERLNYNDLPESLKTHKNRKGFLDRFKVVAADLPFSQTVVAHISKDGHYYIHPDNNQNRSISVREAARLQSFPDNYYFEGVKEKGNRTAAFKQIGNAVPPLMAQKIAEKLKEILQNND